MWPFPSASQSWTPSKLTHWPRTQSLCRNLLSWTPATHTLPGVTQAPSSGPFHCNRQCNQHTGAHHRDSAQRPPGERMTTQVSELCMPNRLPADTHATGATAALRATGHLRVKATTINNTQEGLPLPPPLAHALPTLQSHPLLRSADTQGGPHPAVVKRPTCLHGPCIP